MKFSIMDRTGHSTEAYDIASPTELAAAQAKFDELIASRGHIAAAVRGEGKNEVIKAFDPTAQEILFIPKLQGG